MSLHLYRDLEELKKRLVHLGNLVEVSIDKAVDAFVRRDRANAELVVTGDRDVDTAEVRLEEDCLKVLALHQPVAKDLRFVITVLKINSDLERMGDAAESVASRALQLQELPQFALPEELTQMVAMARGMTRKSLECFVREDAQAAREVLSDDRAVDTLQRRMFDLLQAEMKRDPAHVDPAILVLSMSRQVERIADLATNIAENVIFQLEGEIVRHRRAQMRLV
jgi:phosphate transport system protein